MKKFLLLIVCLVSALVLVACGGAKEAEYKLGMGVVVSLESSKTGTAQVDATVATVVTDVEGKIVAARIDVAQNAATLADGAFTFTKLEKSKRELGSAYGMAGKVDNDDNGTMKEWFEQADAFEAWLVGKTASDLKAMKFVDMKGHQVADDADLLAAGCSMQTTDFQAAVLKAMDDAQGFTFTAKAGTFTLGVAATSFDDGSAAATADAEGTIKMYTDFAASAVVEGKIVASINDAIQPSIKFNMAGEITAKTYNATKRELKEGYNMSTYGANQDPNGDGKVLEWYLQSQAFSKHVVGMTGAEVAAMETKTNSIGYQMSTNEALLAAGCTIQITAIKAVVAKSVTNAR